jgi:hypothetical protein
VDFNVSLILLRNQGRAPPSRALAARRLVRKEQLEEMQRQEALKRPLKRKGMYRLLKKVRELYLFPPSDRLSSQAVY